MNLSNLTPAKGSVKTNKRLGRGQGSGGGGTATRGHKGAKSRSGYSRKRGFEGGQMPLQRRLPKFGFTNNNRVEYKAINLSVLEALVEKGITVFNPESLYQAGVAPKNSLIKILGNGELKSKVEVKAHAFSESAKAAIEAKQGTAEKING
jgi:large subunit ribosomal protein L15